MATLKKVKAPAPTTLVIKNEWPAHLKEALRDVGIAEKRGGEHPEILKFFADAGFPGIKEDEVAWCAAFVGAHLRRAGYKPSGSLMARSYSKWGAPVSDYTKLLPGDVVVFPRGGNPAQGHVVFFVDRKGFFIRCVGGNQSNKVSVQTFDARKAVALRRPTPSWGEVVKGPREIYPHPKKLQKNGAVSKEPLPIDVPDAEMVPEELKEGKGKRTLAKVAILAAVAYLVYVTILARR